MKIDLKKEISLPNLSMPRLGRPSIARKPKSINGTPSRRAPAVKVPKTVSDLYEDLRDRHLLPLVALLVVAIIGAPIVLGSKGGSDESAAPPIVSSGESHDSAFTVVQAERSLRSPEKRLGHRRPLNPFRTGQAPEAAHSGGAQKASGSTAVSQATGTTVETSTTETSSETVPSGSQATESPPSESAPPDSPVIPAPETETGTRTESTTTESTSETAAPQAPLYVTDLKVGFDPENLQSLEGVQPMTKLPNPKNPAILYIGPSQDHKHALFLLTTEVTAYYGGARCVLDKLSCELIELDPGKSATFEMGLGEEATRYKIRVDGIEPVSADGQSAKRTTKTETHTATPATRSRAIGNAQRFTK
ncbi:MAG: hypothetical protein JST53_03860 [Actinobacteria bacterium]|nr:hypothetical protein [Actinomycetota bacterium]